VREMESVLNDATTAGQRVFDTYYQMLLTRTSQPAFHPAASQEVIDLSEPSVIAFVRTSVDDRQRILVVANVSSAPVSVFLPAPFSRRSTSELLCLGAAWGAADSLRLSPAAVVWLATRTGS